MTIRSIAAVPEAQEPWAPAFQWHVCDIGSRLPRGWVDQLLDIAARRGSTRDFRPTVSTAREENPAEIPMEAVDGDILAVEAPWLSEMYAGAFLRLGGSLTRERVHPSPDPRIALSLNVLRGAVRYPCHVDSNPLQGLLYLTDCTADSGGELAVARNPCARNTDEVDADCVLVRPQAGQLFFFDARRNPHYVRPLRSPDTVRAVVTMNYYSDSCPESTRPQGLDEALFAARPARLAGGGGRHGRMSGAVGA
ncbi:2OG-Fe(II) oxygenase [Streptomycetaceae bacterium NBC_01309]